MYATRLLAGLDRPTIKFRHQTVRVQRDLSTANADNDLIVALDGEAGERHRLRAVGSVILPVIDHDVSQIEMMSLDTEVVRDSEIHFFDKSPRPGGLAVVAEQFRIRWKSAIAISKATGSVSPR